MWIAGIDPGLGGAVSLIWETIPGTGGFYEASTSGQIRSIDRVIRYQNQFGPCQTFFKGKKLKQTISNSGYCRVSLSTTKYKKLFSVHRLIAATFHGPCPEGMECSHLNGNQKDNRPENLKWVTSKENHQHRIVHETNPVGERHPRSKLTEEDILKIKERRDYGETYVAIAKDYAITPEAVSMAARGVNWGFLL